ncbi:MAG: Arylsulfatase precursor [candidate division WS6 bacterium OLB20]|uniref:Arylsulfatase n=1 Tax=candidate division WS6 bacterium OLB20 TaxID=1617426 RepID=A0A136LZB7_9BACT|nr:MAG: Arylsulfatase precursor [candidate division WS6 bacterium OLB20]
MLLRVFIAGILVFAPLVTPSVTAAQGNVAANSGQKPNVILILADDLGYAEIEPFGGTFAKTPNLAQLRREGMKFNRFYSNPLCGPTRSSLMTGLYSQRFGFRVNCDVSTASPKGMPTEVSTLGNIMRSAGYSTWHVGKWHLGYDADTNYPTKRGFDYYLGPFEEQTAWQRRNPTLHENNSKRQFSGHPTEIYGNKVVDIIRQNAGTGKPFFINYWDTAPHGPNQPLPRWLNGYQDKNSVYTKYAAEITGLDEQVGKIVTALKETGQWNNTVLVFMSDNGIPSSLLTFSNNGGLRGNKSGVFEGGVRSPMLISWPAAVAAGSETSLVSHVTDIAPTFSEIAGVTGAASDGRSIVPTLRGQAQQPRDIFFENKTLDLLNGAFISGEWKYVWNKGNEYLFNLSTDPGEKTDLKNSRPVEFTTLKTRYWGTRTALAEVPYQFTRSSRGTASFPVKTISAKSGSDIGYLAGSSVLNISGWEFSFDSWIRLDGNGGNKRRNIINSFGNFRFEVMENGRPRATWKETAKNGTVTERFLEVGTALRNDTWQHIALVLDATPSHAKSGAVRIYIDGKNAGSGKRTGDIITTGQFTIANTPSTQRPLLGELYQPRISTAAWLPAEVAWFAGSKPIALGAGGNTAQAGFPQFGLDVLPLTGADYDNYGSYTYTLLSSDGEVEYNYSVTILENNFVGYPDENGVIVLPFDQPQNITLSVTNGIDTLTRELSPEDFATAGGHIIDRGLLKNLDPESSPDSAPDSYMDPVRAGGQLVLILCLVVLGGFGIYLMMTTRDADEIQAK